MTKRTMSITDSVFATKRYIPLDEGLLHNFVGEKKMADIREEDLILVTRRLPPRPMPARDLNRTFNTERTQRKEYVSYKQSAETLLLAQKLKRSEDTRRMNGTTIKNTNGPTYR
jgi:hypothetical protein